MRPEDKKLAKNVWDLVQQNNDPSNAPYHFTVRCSPGGAECPAGRYLLTSLSFQFPLPIQDNTIIHLNIIALPSISFFHCQFSPRYLPSRPQFIFFPSPFFFLLPLKSITKQPCHNRRHPPPPPRRRRNGHMPSLLYRPRNRQRPQFKDLQGKPRPSRSTQLVQPRTKIQRL